MLTIRPDRIYRTGVIEAFDRRYDFGPDLHKDMSAFVVGPTVQQRPQRPQRTCAPCACRAVAKPSNQLAPAMTTSAQQVTAAMPTLNVRPIVQPRRNVIVSNPAAPIAPSIAKATAKPSAPSAPSIAKATAYPNAPTAPTITSMTVR